MPKQRGGLWRHRDFRLFWIGETTSQVGTAVTFVALPLVAVDSLHANNFVVTVLTATTWLPWLVVGLPAGGWVDRLAPRPVLLICDACSFAAFTSVPVAAWLGVLGIPQLVLVALVAGGASVFFTTAYQVYLPSIIGQADLTEGNAKLTGSRSAAQVGGPCLGGVIAQVAGATTGLLADAISFAVSFACLTAIRKREARHSTAAGTPRHLVGEVRLGLRLVLADPYLRPQVVFGATANLFLTGMNAIEVVFLVRTVGVGAGTVGVLLAATSAGGVLGAAVARPLAERWGTSRTACVAVTAGLPFALVLPLTTSGAGLLTFVGGLFMVDAGTVASNVITSSFRQTYVPADMLGRVSACSMTASYSLMPAGALLAGGLSEILDIRAALWILAAGIAASGSIFLASPMRHTRDFPPAPTEHLTGPHRNTIAE